MGIYLPGAGTLGCVVWPEAGIPCLLTPEVSLPILIHHMWVWDSSFCHLSMGHHISGLSLSPSLLFLWMNVASLNSWLSDVHLAQVSDGSGYYLFWSLVVVFFCSCVREQSVFTHASILTGSPNLCDLKKKLMMVFILESSLYDSTDHDIFAHYSVSSVRESAWHTAGNEEILVE